MENSVRWYILDENHKPVAVPMLVAALEMEKGVAKRQVARKLLHKRRNIFVSTVFLSLDHGYGEHGAPVLFETMIFGTTQHGYQRRYCTWDEALKGHAETVRLARQVRWGAQ